MQDFILTIVSSLTLSGALTAALVFLAKNLISTRLKQSIEHEYSAKLETYKHSLKAEHEIAVERLRASNAQDSAIRSAATASFTEGHKAALEKRLSAIESTWKSINYLRSNTFDALNKLDIILPSEFQTFLTNANMRRALDDLSMERIDSLMDNEQTREVDAIRPFIGEYIYSLYYAYRALTGRVAYILLKGREAGRISPWYDDAAVRQLISVFMTGEEVNQFNAVECGKFGWMRCLIDQKMLSQMSRIVSGEESGNLALEQAHKIFEAASTLRNAETAVCRVH